MLVSIYGTSELFVNEYRNMLADRLLTITDYDTDKELRVLELLKLKFGEMNLHNCEIMIKDLADSKRINNQCKNSPGNKYIDTTIVSYLFWPNFKEEKFELPSSIQE